MPSFDAAEQLAEIDLVALKDQERYLYNHNEGSIVVSLAESQRVRCRASGVEVWKGRRVEVKTMYRENLPIVVCPWSMPGLRGVVIWRMVQISSLFLLLMSKMR